MDDRVAKRDPVSDRWQLGPGARLMAQAAGEMGAQLAVPR